ncbi:hypothetical protein PSACC_01965 [Paramicrosporidium saccamoebae]|uniref:Uncharacterized protein n=1 Tax=Paramicrosporidium saccamoebae TaxID=1246581 RepID=A0A2H9TKK9_9FUNG|nr:hypothetical protein PSACC_01965 [Paramicrosporidium saccamoebae]
MVWSQQQLRYTVRFKTALQEWTSLRRDFDSLVERHDILEMDLEQVLTTTTSHQDIELAMEAINASLCSLVSQCTVLLNMLDATAKKSRFLAAEVERNDNKGCPDYVTNAQDSKSSTSILPNIKLTRVLNRQMPSKNKRPIKSKHGAYAEYLPSIVGSIVSIAEIIGYPSAECEFICGKLLSTSGLCDYDFNDDAAAKMIISSDLPITTFPDADNVPRMSETVQEMDILSMNSDIGPLFPPDP